jgi:pectinacetylesterase
VRRVAALTVVLLVLVAACSDDPSTASSPPSTTPTIDVDTVVDDTTPPPVTAAATTPEVTSPATTSAPATTAVVPISGWEQVTASGECMCADGSPYSYWIHRADLDKVVFFLQGGGACFDSGTCAFNSNAYRVHLGPNDDPNTFKTGVFDFTDTRNPLADYSFVFAPYCTGDVHIGNASHEYGPQLTVQHKGSVNASTALNALATQFPDTAQLMVTGESAGSVPTPLYAGLAHDLLPNAEITVLADGSGAYPDVPAINSVIGAVWGTEAAIPPWPENAGLTAATWSFPGLFVQAGKHDPEIIFGRHDYAFDMVQQFFAGLAGIASDDLVTLIDQNETQIEQSGVDLRSYIAPGQAHTVLSSPVFYTENVEGVALVDWVSGLVRRQPDLDVHCTDCVG